ncbi:MAG TPA: aminodeoxychorismate synthase component I [Gemmataceae bacterium]|nr:aminodeoxychorismate synthase component I [Gemmataceae bacterium]
MNQELQAADSTDRQAAGPCPGRFPLVEELTPAPNPWEAFRRLARLRHVLFLDSALIHSYLGRYSFLAADPPEFFWSHRGRLSGSARPRASAERRGQAGSSDFHAALQAPDPFGMIAERLARYPRAESVPGLPPFQGGAAGLFGYDLCHHLERLPRPRFDEFGVPDLAIGIYDWVLAFDHAEGRAWLISTGFPEVEPRRRRWAERRLAEVKHRVQADPESRSEGKTWLSRLRLTPSSQYPVSRLPGLLSNFDRAGYLEAVQRAIEYVHAGDCFQVNLAQRLLYPWKTPPIELYRRLRERNPAPFAGYFDLGRFVIASASPERFLRVESDGEVEARPIKGTRPRGATPAEDQARRDELRDSAKDRAENVMIVDLLRNDLGRVCRYGTVRVPAVCRVETYQYVHHLVSEVRGRLRPGLGPVDLLRAAFPGGSVTGAPKIRAMEIIAELEPTTRGPYCGSLGYIGFDGRMDTSILIRTFTIGGGWVQFPVGGGIVADSVPEREYEETWHKAEGLLRALCP